MIVPTVNYSMLIFSRSRNAPELNMGTCQWCLRARMELCFRMHGHVEERCVAVSVPGWPCGWSLVYSS